MIKEIIEKITDVKTKHHIEGVWGEDFPAEKTAQEVCKVEKSLKSSIDAVNFYFNRCGKNCKDWGEEKKSKIIDALKKICKD